MKIKKLHPLLLTKEVARLFGVSERTIVSWANKGKIPALKLRPNGKYRYIREDIINLLIDG